MVHICTDCPLAFSRALCVCLLRQILVVHAGLSRLPNVTLAEINALKVTHARKSPSLLYVSACSCLVPSPQRARPIPTYYDADTPRHDVILQDLMWSDPQDADGIQPSTRHAGVLFGPDITKE